MSATSSADRSLPHPPDRWYDRDIGTTGGGIAHPFRVTPAQRRSYVRYILAGHGGERSWEIGELADWEPEALAPWADAVTAFDDAAIQQLTEVARLDYWRASRGASDAAVDRLADRIAASGPGTAPAALVHLLIGVETPRALVRLADLARRDPGIADLCALHGLWIAPEGAAVRRYTRQPRIIVGVDRAAEPGLRMLPPVAEGLADPRGLGCALPLTTILDVDLALLRGTPFAAAMGTGQVRRHPFVGSLCADCDADEEMADYRGWWTVDGKAVFDEERDERCSGHALPPQPVPLTRLGLRHSDRYVPDDRRQRHTGQIGVLGGRPSWLQNPLWPDCCGRPMVYVGQTSQRVIGGFDQHLYGFACECGSGSQLGRHT